MAGYKNVNREDFEFKKVTYKFQGEYIEKYLNYLYFNLPVFSSFFAFFAFVFYSVNFTNLAFFFFWSGFVFFITSLYFLYAMKYERLDIAVIGEINKSRDLVFEFSNKAKAIKYYANFGTAVFDFLGKDPSDSVKSNLKTKNKRYDLLIDKKIYTMGLWVPGSTGSGKTVTLNSCVFIPALQTGNGFWYIEGKGDPKITEGIMALVYQYGREFDAFVLNFAAAASGLYTHGINPLRVGNALVTTELLKNLVNEMQGDNSWVTDMAFAFMQALLVPLVLLRDMELLISKDELNSVNKLKDLKSKKQLYLNITQLNNYLGFQEMIDLLYMMRRLFKDKEFVEEARKITQYSRLKDFEYSINSEMEQFLTRHSVPVDSITKPDYNTMDEKTKQHNNHAIQPWSSTLIIFGSERVFGNIFNKEYDDFNPLTAIQTAKIVITVLPAMAYSEDFCRKIGKMMTAISKAAIGEMLSRANMEGNRAEKSRSERYRPKKLPYALVYDEPNSYGSVNIATMSSMVRSIGTDGGGMAIVWSGQSYADVKKMDDGKGLAGEQLTANLGLVAALNTDDKELQKFLSEKAGEKYVYFEDRSDVVKGSRGDNDIRNYRREKIQEYPPDFFSRGLKAQTGETMVMMKGYEELTKVISNFTPEVESTQIKFNRNVSYQVLFDTFKTASEINDIIKVIEENSDEEAKEFVKSRTKSNLSYKEEVLELLKKIARECYPNVSNIEDFKLILIDEKDKKVHGTYTPATSEIRLYDSINNPREHLVGVAIHELAHHVEYCIHGESGHSKRFYLFMKTLIEKAIEHDIINYTLSRDLKHIDSDDIEKMEKYHGAPSVKRAA